MYSCSFGVLKEISQAASREAYRTAQGFSQARWNERFPEFFPQGGSWNEIWVFSGALELLARDALNNRVQLRQVGVIDN